MEKLTPREEELMRCFWTRGPLFVRELVALWPEPKPHFNTLSTMGVVSKYFDNSYLGVVSSLVREEKISVDDLRDLIRQIESQTEKR